MIRSAIQERAASDARFERWLGLATILVLRLIALGFLAMTLITWGRTVGFFSGDEFRFDTMAVPMRIYAAALCVLLPVTAVGLWTTLTWGRVVWLLAVVVQVSAFVFFSDVVAVDRAQLAFHALTLSVYFALEIATRIVTNDA